MVLKESPNLFETRVAILEVENDTIYLYNYPLGNNQDTKAMWVANIRKDRSDCNIKEDMQKGKQPYLPEQLCNENGYINKYDNSDEWKIQWGLEQNSIALYLKGQLIAIMPEWSGYKGFRGYAVGVSEETPVAWPLLPDNPQIARFEAEQKFVADWSAENWNNYQETVLRVYDQWFPYGHRYFAIDGEKGPLLGLHYAKNDNKHFFATVGLTQLPMPLLNMDRPDDLVEDYRRIELAILVNNISSMDPLADYLSANSRYPWYSGTHFDHGHTMPCAELSQCGSTMSFMAIIEQACFLPQLQIPKFLVHKTRLLFMVPIYESEQIFAKKNTTAELIIMLEKSPTPLDINRKPVI